MSSSSLASMAWRNLWRNRRRTIITLSSISFGILLAVLFTGLGDRTYGSMIDLAARMGGGHVTLQHPGYLEAPSIKKTIRDVDVKAAAALKDHDVTHVVTRITGFVMLSTASNNTGAFFMAYDPEMETKKTLAVLDGIVEGNNFASSTDSGIILGKSLAENLNVQMGKKVVYTLSDKQGEIVTGLARVSGIVTTGAPSIDSGLCLLPIDTVRKVLGFEETEAVQVAVFIDDQRKSQEVADRISAHFDENTAVVPWFESQPELSAFITMKVSGTTFFEIIIMILIAAGIFNTLFVSVMERMREFGIMMAIGFTPGRLFRLVMWESLWLALTGLVAGAIITAWPYYYFSTTGLDMSAMVGEGGANVAGVAMDPVMRVGIFPENALLICFAVILATMLSGLYPAFKAGRVVPVETIKLV